eukprot:TRINITY_DN14996_c0_g1_i4.p1 TRINITY_DN14996_c0_g1~~TRINITY_DN14996_c0_g1_i4.p1  ORF type:complete len:628 (+),score=43.89 TRINITY_DN14996_c0_g1_i4:85-1884(+)
MDNEAARSVTPMACKVGGHRCKHCFIFTGLLFLLGSVIALFGSDNPGQQYAGLAALLKHGSRGQEVGVTHTLLHAQRANKVSDAPSPCGSCEAEQYGRELWWSKGWEDPWVPPWAEGQWQGRQWSVLTPEAYPAYKSSRDSCSWVPSGTLFEHNAKYVSIRAGMNYTHYLESHGKNKKNYKKFFRENELSAPTHVCILPPNKSEDKYWTQWYITRVGPIHVTKAGRVHNSYGFGGFIVADGLDVILAAPESGDTTVLEAVEAVHDAHDHHLPYPPLHTHHSDTGYFGVAKPGHAVYPAQWGPPASHRTFLRHADLDNCIDTVHDPNACAHAKAPSHLSWHIPEGQVVRTMCVYNMVGERWQGGDIFFEFARKFSVKANQPSQGAVPEGRQPFFFWDLAMGGSGASYLPRAVDPKNANRRFGSVAWYVYPVKDRIRIHSSFMHSHTAVSSELFILQGDVEKALPQHFVKQCYDDKSCSREGPGFGLSMTPGKGLRDMPMSANISKWILRNVMRHTASDGQLQLRCHYKSRNKLVDGQAFVQAALRSSSTASTCEDWTAEEGSHISMLAFNYPLAENRTDINISKKFEMHHRWFAGVSQAS